MTVTIVYLRIYSYRGLSIGASHYYAELKGYDGNDLIVHNLEKTLTPHEAAKLNDGSEYGLLYKAGQKYNGFNSEEELIKLAMDCFKTTFPDARILIRGDGVYYEPQKVLWCERQEVIAEVDSMIAECEKLGWFDNGNTKAVDKICDQWGRLLDEFK